MYLSAATVMQEPIVLAARFAPSQRLPIELAGHCEADRYKPGSTLGPPSLAREKFSSSGKIDAVHRHCDCSSTAQRGGGRAMTTFRTIRRGAAAALMIISTGACAGSQLGNVLGSVLGGGTGSGNQLSGTIR